MKTIFYSLFIFAIFVGTQSCSKEEPTSLSEDLTLSTRAKKEAKITGQLSFAAFNIDLDWRTFSITAQKDVDGNVTGTYKRIRRVGGNANNELTGGGDVLCFDIVGNYANVILFEEIFDSTQHYFLRIYDGGNGIGADSMTQNIPFNPDFLPIEFLCDATFDAGLMVAGEAGNIKFH